MWFNNGDIGSQAFLILNGSAVVKRESWAGALHKGDLFGEMVLLKTIFVSGYCSWRLFVILVVDYETIFVTTKWLKTFVAYFKPGTNVGRAAA